MQLWSRAQGQGSTDAVLKLSMLGVGGSSVKRWESVVFNIFGGLFSAVFRG